MDTIVLIIHLLLAIGLVGVILLQRSEGGALGIGGGGGGGGGGFMSARGQASLLTRVTMILGALFFGTSILLAILAGTHSEPTSIFDTTPSLPTTPELPSNNDGTPSVPLSQ